MDIAIIGTGNVGRALATSLPAPAITSRSSRATRPGPARSPTSSARTRPRRPAMPSRRAMRSSSPCRSRPPMRSRRRSPRSPAGKLVIDATNPLKPDLSGLATEPGTSGARALRREAPGSRASSRHSTPCSPASRRTRAHGVTVDGLYATDDEEAVRDRRRARVDRAAPGQRRGACERPRAEGHGLPEHQAPGPERRRRGTPRTPWSVAGRRRPPREKLAA